MIDFHTHILPAVDDGSKDIEMTEAMLEMESSMGVKHIVATPHFYAHKMGVEDFVRRRAAAFDSIVPLLETAVPMDIRLGAEVYYFDGIGRADKLAELLVEGTKTLLLEMPFCAWDEHVYSDVHDLIVKKNYRVVLAHIERYPEFQKKPFFGKSVFDRVLELPLILQINAGSFYGDRKKTKFCDKLIENGNDIIIGSDCHNLTSRQPNLEKAESYIASNYGEGVFEEMQSLCKEVSGI